nr:MAG TPA: hypothetical protein [Caudoviricetes sp.]
MPRIGIIHFYNILGVILLLHAFFMLFLHNLFLVNFTLSDNIFSIHFFQLHPIHDN